ncbi:MAG: methylaspartate mutase subunit E [Candidatus Aminicenantes bacterium]|nr:methylaspartate mutase subunit E [Candidatus Aminicenantes bacterium]
MDIVNQKWSDDYFSREREKVLAMWPTGKEVNLDEAVEYHKSLPGSLNAALKVQEAKAEGVSYFLASSGTDTIEGHKELLLYLKNEAGVHIVTTYIDSLTRNCRFKDAEQGLKKARETGKAALNGFPIVLHGIKGSREIIEAAALPVLILGPTPDVRLTCEIGLAGGHSGYSGGPLIAFWNYTKDIPVEKIIYNFQYLNRLMGYYEENGIPLLYCVSGAMPSISPPSIMIAPEIIEVLIAAEQGTKHIQLNNWVQGNISQDVAYILTLKKLALEYLDKFGYRDVETTTLSVCPTGRFPVDQAQTFGLIAHFTITGILGGVQVISTRTIDEALQIPTKEGITESFKCVKAAAGMLQPQALDILDSKAVKSETYMMEKEVKAILDKVIEMGDGDLVIGTKKAVKAGVLDQPYATTQYVKGKVMGVKDARGAARFFDCGYLPFDKEIFDYHKDKIAQREKKTGKKVDYGTVIKDMTAISTGSILPGE